MTIAIAFNKTTLHHLRRRIERAAMRQIEVRIRRQAAIDALHNGSRAIPGKVGTGFLSGIATNQEVRRSIPGKVGTGFPSGIATNQEVRRSIPGKVGTVSATTNTLSCVVLDKSEQHDDG